MKFTAKQLAEQLNNHNYDDSFTKYVLKTAKDNKLVIVTATGLDCVTFIGAIEDEADCYMGGELFLDKEYVYTRQSKEKDRKPILSIYDKKSVYVWKFMTKIPHSKFIVLKDGKRWCEAIIFCIDDICP
jgi:hypothetical protein